MAFESNNHEMEKLRNSLVWRQSFLTMNPELDNALAAIQKTNSNRPTTKTTEAQYALIFSYRIIDVMSFYGGGGFNPQRTHRKDPALPTFNKIKVNISFVLHPS